MRLAFHDRLVPRVCAAALLAFTAAGCTPRAAAMQTHLSWSEDPRTTMTVMWQTSGASPSAVRHGPDRKVSHTVEATRPRYARETGVLHEAVLRGLTPGTPWYYQVGQGPVRSFVSAPEGASDFAFTAAGDFGVGADARKNLERMAADAPAFSLGLGDLSYANGKQEVWDEWLRNAEPFASRTPWMAVLGNHEDEGQELGDAAARYDAFLTRFAHPAPETWYRFDYAGVRFIGIDTHDITLPEQRAWLEETLRAAKTDPAVRWIVAFHHHPLYSSTKERTDDAKVIGALGALFDRYGVDLSLAGHNHNYERSLPVKAGAPQPAAGGVSKRGDGVVYVTSGGGGQGLYDFEKDVPAKTAMRAEEYHYLRVRVTDAALAVEAVRTKDGTILDRFEIRR